MTLDKLLAITHPSTIVAPTVNCFHDQLKVQRNRNVERHSANLRMVGNRQKMCYEVLVESSGCGEQTV